MKRVHKDAMIFQVAAAEALARIGTRALPALESLAASNRVCDRLWAYYATGLIREPAALDMLLAALESDAEMMDVVAMALSDTGDARAIEPLKRALERAEPWQRLEVENAIRDLHGGVVAGHDEPQDWRIRYRLNEIFGRFPLSWAAIAAVAHEDPEFRKRSTPLRPIDEILSGSDEEEPDCCDCCGVPMWMGTGIYVCGQTAAAIAALQAGMLERRVEATSTEDVFEMLDSIETELVDVHMEPERRSRRARQRRDDQLSGLRMLQAGLMWAVERGAETMEDACRILLAAAARAAEEHGDPMGTVQPPELPRLTTSDDEPLVFTRSHYEVTDADALLRALNACPDLDFDEKDNRFVWFVELEDDARRVLGSIDLTQAGRLVLECMSIERHERGRQLLESIAGTCINHRMDTQQDPWQAMEEARTREGPGTGDEVPPEIAGPVIHRPRH